MNFPSGYVSHTLISELLGEATAIVPESWGANTGFVLIYGDIYREVPLIRIHSRCAYGEAFGSHHCECRDQLELAGRRIRSAVGGMIFYLEQEGRSAGILSKARAYRASLNEGVDTFDFYEQCGLNQDPREYSMVINVLQELGIDKVKLLSNNPSKASALIKNDIGVDLHSLEVTPFPEALTYMEAKRRHGHML